MRCWYVQIGKKQHKLSPDRDEAFRLYHELMNLPPEVQPPPSVEFTSPLAAEILDAFLDWCSQHRAKRTYHHERENIQRLAERLPEGLTVEDMKPFHVTRAMADFPHRSNNTKHDFISVAKRAFSWAVDEELIERSPIERMKKPAREARDVVISPEEYASVVETIREPNFRDLIELSWETGARVQELRKIEARYLDLKTDRVVFPPKQSKGKKYHRVIYLTDRAKEILSRLATEHPRGPILTNSEGASWTKDAINCAFCRLQLALGRKAITEQGLLPPRPPRFKKGGIEADKIAAAHKEHRALIKKWQKDEVTLARELGTKYHLSAFRKGFATEALKAGVDTVTVAHLLGHRDASMVSRVYGHVQQDPEHMAAAAKRAKRTGSS
jgi:integrase